MHPPQEDAMINCVYQPFEVVSLLEILKHDAAAFWELSQLMEKIATDTIPYNSSMSFNEMGEHCKKLGLKVSLSELNKFLKQTTLAINGDGFSAVDMRNFGKHFSSVVHSELSSKVFVYVAEDRAKYLDSAWVNDLSLLFVFDKAEKELLAAGRCYAHGEPNACVFHSMRALEPCLKALAKKLDVEYNHSNWQTVISSIEAKIRGLSSPSQQGKKLDEDDRKEREFYSQLATQFAFLKDGWRNHVMHGTQNYSDRDAKLIMDTVGNVLRVAAIRLEESDDEPASLRGKAEESPKRLSRGDEEKA
jgi:HEPN domain-containing protein